jgi:proteasome lid subunit RPN8/RPN11
MYLSSTGLELIGQVHSHPGEFVGHSKGDDRRALMPYEGFLSVVVPHYAREGMLPLTICGVHVFESSRFRRLQTVEVEAQFRILPEFSDLRNQ